MPQSERVDAYLAALPEAPRRALASLRRTIRAAAPGAEETIAYDMPAFRINGRFLLSYAAYKRHCSLFPASQAVLEACGEELKPYMTGVATIQFRPDRPLPETLLKKIIAARLAERLTPVG